MLIKIRSIEIFQFLQQSRSHLIQHILTCDDDCSFSAYFQNTVNSRYADPQDTKSHHIHISIENPIDDLFHQQWWNQASHNTSDDTQDHTGGSKRMKSDRCQDTLNHNTAMFSVHTSVLSHCSCTSVRYSAFSSSSDA